MGQALSCAARNKAAQDLLRQVACTHSKGHIAAGKSDSGTVSYCSDDSALAHPKTVLINALNVKQQTPLMIAASRGHADIVQILINEGASIHVADKAKGSTALHYAAMHGHVECVKTLLCAAGLQPRGNHVTSNALYSTPIDAASHHVENSEASLRTHQVASRRRYDFINCLDSGGATALHLASRAGAAEVVKLLCEYGADVNAVFLQGSTPLHIAAEQGHRAVALAILKHIYEHNGVQDPRDMCDDAGHKPHQLAVLSQHQRLAAILQPDLPLHRLFDCPDAENTESSIPKLAVIAAHALKQQLCTVLDQLETQVSMDAPSDDQGQLTEKSCEPCAEYDAAMSPCRTSWESGSSSSMSEITHVDDNPIGFAEHCDERQSKLLQSMHHLQSPHTNMLPQHAADMAECPVCYEEIDMSHMVSCQPCHHQLCVPCARHVCTAIKTKPAACPMCRANIHGFMLMIN